MNKPSAATVTVCSGILGIISEYYSTKIILCDYKKVTRKRTQQQILIKSFRVVVHHHYPQQEGLAAAEGAQDTTSRQGAAAAAAECSAEEGKVERIKVQ